MGTTTWTPDRATYAGVTPVRHGTLTASTETYKFRNDGNTRLLCEKTGAGACTMTMVTPATLQGRAVADDTVVIAATTGDVVAGPFAPSVYNDSNGDMSITFSETTGLTVAVVQG